MDHGGRYSNRGSFTGPAASRSIYANAARLMMVLSMKHGEDRNHDDSVGSRGHPGRCAPYYVRPGGAHRPDTMLQDGAPMHPV